MWWLRKRREREEEIKGDWKRMKGEDYNQVEMTLLVIRISSKTDKSMSDIKQDKDGKKELV